MAFELIYLYIDDIGRNIKQCGIPFSNRFEVIYDGDEKNIFIEMEFYMAFLLQLLLVKQVK